MGIIKKIADALRKTKEALSRKIDALLSHGELDEDFYDEIFDILLSCDIGVSTTEKIVDGLRKDSRNKKLRTAEDVKSLLREQITEILGNEHFIFKFPAIITIVGVNGVGKTTSIGKLANYFCQQKKTVTLVAGDTFRAAASNQLEEWANKTKTRIVKHEEGADAAAVVFDGISSAKAKKTDVLIIDTAGRLHTKTNLMQELSKIGRIVEREYQEANKYTFIVIDATTGQNALSQIDAFNEYIKIDGIILTKLDGTAKGGVVLCAKEKYHTPVLFVGTGEGVSDFEEFDSKNFAENII